MAPEIIQRKRYTEKADVYSFGVLLNELYTETIPYTNTEYGRMSFDKVYFTLVLNLPSIDSKILDLNTP